MRRTLAFPTPPAAAPDRAVAALPALRALLDALRSAAARPAGRWGEPPLFFFRPEFQAELPPPAADPLRDRIAAAEEWLADAEVRHAARAVPGLAAAAAAYPGAAALAAKLAIPDDEVFLVLHPAAGLGWRFVARGVADLGQFHMLLADAVAAPRPPAAVVDAYRAGGESDGPAPVAKARYQLFQPHAVRPDGTLPTGLGGADYWLWNHHPLAAVPAVDGERVVLLGEPAVPAEWDAEPRFPDVPASVAVVEVISTSNVDAWLREWAGAAPLRRAAPAVLRAA